MTEFFAGSRRVDCVREIKRMNPNTAVEALTPDFNGVMEHVELVVDSGLEVFAQNVETVKRLTHPVRDPRAGYRQTIDVLAHAKKHRWSWDLSVREPAVSAPSTLVIRAAG